MGDQYRGRELAEIAEQIGDLRDGPLDEMRERARALAAAVRSRALATLAIPAAPEPVVRFSTLPKGAGADPRDLLAVARDVLVAIEHGDRGEALSWTDRLTLGNQLASAIKLASESPATEGESAPSAVEQAAHLRADGQITERDAEAVRDFAAMLRQPRRVQLLMDAAEKLANALGDLVDPDETEGIHPTHWTVEQRDHEARRVQSLRERVFEALGRFADEEFPPAPAGPQAGSAGDVYVRVRPGVTVDRTERIGREDIVRVDRGLIEVEGGRREVIVGVEVLGAADVEVNGAFAASQPVSDATARLIAPAPTSNADVDPEPDWGEEIEGFDLPLGDLSVAIDRTSSLTPVSVNYRQGPNDWPDLPHPVQALRDTGEKLVELAAFVQRAEARRKAGRR